MFNSPNMDLQAGFDPFMPPIKNNKTKQDKNKEYTEVSGSTANAKFKSR